MELTLVELSTTAQTFFPFQVTLYFKLCKNVTVSGISILHSNGTRLAFLDTVGKVEIANSDRGTLLNVVHGGLFVSFLGSSNNNKVEILSSTFDENNCSMESSLVSQYSTEGGARINFESKLHDNQ